MPSNPALELKETDCTGTCYRLNMALADLAGRISKLQSLVSALQASPPSSLTVPVTVPNGGTGDTSLAAHGVLVGKGTSPVITVAAAGGSNNFLTEAFGADPVFRTIATADGPGLAGTVTLAKITPGGTNGSLTVAGGFITAYTPPT